MPGKPGLPSPASNSWHHSLDGPGSPAFPVATASHLGLLIQLPSQAEPASLASSGQILTLTLETNTLKPFLIPFATTASTHPFPV